MYIIPPVLSFAGNTVLGLYLFVKNPHSKVTHAFSILAFLMIGWAFSEIMMRSQPDPESALFWGKILYFHAFFLPSAFLVLAYVYTGGRNPLYVAASYGLGLGFLPLLFTRNFVESMKIIPPWGYDVEVGVLFSYFVVAYLGIIAIGTFILMQYYRRSSLLERRRLQTMLMGFLVSVCLIGITNILARMKDLPLPRMGSMFALVATISFAYGVAKYQLLVVPIRGKARTTMDARCGALCSLCSSYLEGMCPSCEEGDAVLRENCPIYICSMEKGIPCEKCPLLLECEIYREYCEKCPFTVERYGLKSRNSYLWEDRDPQVAFEIFRDYTIRGSFGLLITRDYPQKAIKKYNLLDVSVLWLSQVEGHENVIDPTNLPRLTYTVAQFIRQTPESFVFLTGLEYLIVHNGFDRVLKFLHTVNDQVMTHNSRFLVVVDPKTLDPKELSLLEREMHLLKKDNLFKSST